MRCPFCGNVDTQVKDSRPSEEGAAIRRRRHCPKCGARFTTAERLHMRQLYVVKRNGRKVPYNREKLYRSLEIALRKRPVEAEEIEKLVNNATRHFETSGDTDILSDNIGAYITELLLKTDKVAYIRYISVYKDFTNANDFEEIVDRMKEMAQEPA